MNDATPNWSRYQERVRAVIEYIHQNPAESLTNETLAERAHLSQYHWHRIYKSITGVRTEMPLAHVGESVGYPEIHSFTRTFKQFYGVSPGKFREIQMSPESTEEPSAEASMITQTVVIHDKPAVTLIGAWHYGDYMKIGVTFERVMAECAIAGILPSRPKSIGLYLADPECTDEPALKSFAGVVMPSRTPANSGRSAQNAKLPTEDLDTYHYPGGRFAVLTHQGSYALLSQAYDWLYYKWLPSSDVSVRDEPCSEVYLNSPVYTAQTDLLTEVCMPIV